MGYSSSQSVKKRSLVGCDVFIYAHQSVNQLQEKLNDLHAEGLKLVLISNRGVKVWPESHPDTTCIEQWRCRFMSQTSGAAVSSQQIVLLLKQLADSHIDFIKTENLYSFDGKPGYSQAEN
jgi:isocitrate dehydrogenase